MSIDPATGKHRRGTTNRDARGGTPTRRARKAWLLETYAADRALIRVEWVTGETTVEPYVIPLEELLAYDTVVDAVEVPTARCYRCGVLLHFDTLTVDRRVPGIEGGTYARNNIRPACGPCNYGEGGRLAAARRELVTT